MCIRDRCKYVLITNADGGILNDPVLLRLAENKFWLSLADSDVLMRAQGVAVHSGLDVQITEPDVSPLQLQGPNSGLIMQELFGAGISELRYYRLEEKNLDGIPLVVSRTGWSSELGYELYLLDGSRGDELWEKIMAAGSAHGLAAGHTSSIRRIEGGMLSYHADMDISNNPYELGLSRLVNLDNNNEFIGREALQKICDNGVTRKQVGLEISGPALEGANTTFWPLLSRATGHTNGQSTDQAVGKVTSAIYSPRLEKNIALAMLATEYSEEGTKVQVQLPDSMVEATVVKKPFYDPDKSITKSA